MKPAFRIISIIAVFFVSSYTNPVKSSAQGGDVSFQVFYDNLSPYGQWINDPNYGYIWIPNDLGPHFAPYSTNGYWAWTDYGWTWVSNYDWGWAPFHYGRWDYESTYGWFWVPDYTWGPAWVCWSQEPGYYGWCPLGPGISLDLALSGGYHPPMKRWVFMDEHHMGDQHIHRYFIPRANNADYITRGQIIRNTYNDGARHTVYASGPPRADVERVRGSAVTRFEIGDRAQPGHEVVGNRINVYRPTINKASVSNARPARVEVKEHIVPIQQRNQTYQQNHPAQNRQQQPQRQQPQPQQRQQPQPQPQPQQRQQPQPQPRQQPQQRPQPMQRSAPQPHVPQGGGERRR